MPAITPQKVPATYVSVSGKVASLSAVFAQVCARQARKANGQFTPANDGLRRLDFARFGSTPDNRRLNCAPFDQRIERKSASGL
jgi:hypothetical protein